MKITPQILVANSLKKQIQQATQAKRTCHICSTVLVLSGEIIMSNALFSITEETGELILLESGLAALSAIAGKVNVFLTISSSADHIPDKNTITYELVGCGDGSDGCSYCVIDLTTLVRRDDLPSLLFSLCNLLSLSSALFVQFDVEDNNKNITDLSFFNNLQDLFENNLSALQQAVRMPLMHYYSRGSRELPVKAGKRAVDKMLLPETGFSEDIGKRNCTRNILSSLPQHKELIQLRAHEGSIASHPEVADRYACDHLCAQLTRSTALYLINSALYLSPWSVYTLPSLQHGPVPSPASAVSGPHRSTPGPLPCRHTARVPPPPRVSAGQPRPRAAGGSRAAETGGLLLCTIRWP
jgi:hypothetical protein